MTSGSICSGDHLGQEGTKGSSGQATAALALLLVRPPCAPVIHNSLLYSDADAITWQSSSHIVILVSKFLPQKMHKNNAKRSANAVIRCKSDLRHRKGRGWSD